VGETWPLNPDNNLFKKNKRVRKHWNEKGSREKKQNVKERPTLTLIARNLHVGEEENHRVRERER
jgi:hypothetical protein